MEVGVEDRPAVQGSGHRKKEIYSRSLDRALPVRDVRGEVSRTPRCNEKAELRAFLESKRRMIRSHPHLTSAERNRALANIDRIAAGIENASPEGSADGDGGGGDSADDDPPVPGGVGFGVFYRPAYKADFDTGTAADYRIICPTQPGGNVHSWLYLTAMNRAAHCPESLVAYYGREAMRFVVFDWARPERWQAEMNIEGLRPYFHGAIVDGCIRQALHVLTFTQQSSEGRWINEVYLQNYELETFDKVYEFEYKSTLANQQDGWDGSWGPIIETFQHRYQGTEEMGFADFAIATRRGDEWGPWERLSPADTFVARDDTGFRMLYLDPNHTFLAAA